MGYRVKRSRREKRIKNIHSGEHKGGWKKGLYTKKKYNFSQRSIKNVCVDDVVLGFKKSNFIWGEKGEGNREKSFWKGGTTATHNLT